MRADLKSAIAGSRSGVTQYQAQQNLSYLCSHPCSVELFGTVVVQKRCLPGSSGCESSLCRRIAQSYSQNEITGARTGHRPAAL